MSNGQLQDSSDSKKRERERLTFDKSACYSWERRSGWTRAFGILSGCWNWRMTSPKGPGELLCWNHLRWPERFSTCGERLFLHRTLSPGVKKRRCMRTYIRRAGYIERFILLSQSKLSLNPTPQVLRPSWRPCHRHTQSHVWHKVIISGVTQGLSLSELYPWNSVWCYFRILKIEIHGHIAHALKVFFCISVHHPNDYFNCCNAFSDHLMSL